MNQVYLAGPIKACGDDEATEWREQIKRDLHGVDFADPMRRDFRGIEGDHTEEIVEGDKKDIDGCKYVLAYCWKPSAGTSMEILYAWEGLKYVVSVVPEWETVSPWVRYHSTVVYRTLAEAIHYITEFERLHEEELQN